MIRKILQPFYTAYVAVTFLISLFLAFPFFVLVSIGGTMRGRKIIYYIVHYWAKVWLLLIGMPQKIQGPKPLKQRYVIVANHISYLDTIVIFPGLPGYFRALGKSEIAKIPILGFVYKQIVVMVDRSSQKSRAMSMRLMWRALKRESSILIFPEGTFNETGEVLKEFYNGAFRLAIDTQTPILPVLLPDTVHRWHYSRWWKMWPGRNRMIYLDPVPVAGMTIKDVPELKERVAGIMAAQLATYDYP
jgi:1-acyl-sn-glycerol-3-phosphate acyltransferase